MKLSWLAGRTGKCWCVTYACVLDAVRHSVDLQHLDRLVAQNVTVAVQASASWMQHLRLPTTSADAGAGCQMFCL